MGWHEEVDIMVEGQKIQCKSRYAFNRHLQPTENIDIVLIKQNNKEPLIVMKYSQYLQQLKLLKEKV